ncbi:MAG: SMP-30/gluconolactonase/LRE family protein [Candidatus Omnitrophica bacterium]|nr:SMP-30/gluconolactonase/LRE family protein [Candidatus Omnitrophota bacterium]
MRKKIGRILVGLLGILLLYLLLWPVPIDPAAWTPPTLPPMTGAYEPNDRLAHVERMGKGMGVGPEDVAFDDEGRLYTGLLDGRVVRFNDDGTDPEVFVETGGRPLGMVFDASGNLIVADAWKGLLSISPEGDITVLANSVKGEPFVFADDLDIAADGTIYFTDASKKFPLDKLMLDLMEHRPNGRLLAYDPHSASTRMVLNDLYFANGVAISPDQNFVLINETWKYRVKRYWLEGPKKGQTDIFIENLPGFPDNITCNGQDTFWLALVEGPPTREIFDPLLPHPFLRKIITRLPEVVGPTHTPYGFALGLDMNGQVIQNLQDPTGEHYSEVTSVTEHDGMLYFGSLSEDAIGRVAVP